MNLEDDVCLGYLYLFCYLKYLYFVLGFEDGFCMYNSFLMLVIVSDNMSYLVLKLNFKLRMMSVGKWGLYLSLGIVVEFFFMVGVWFFYYICSIRFIVVRVYRDFIYYCFLNFLLFDFS